MNIIKDDELIYVNDNKMGINSCGYNVNSLLFNSGVSPILTINKKSNNSNSNISSLFDNLVVPNWALHYESNKTNKSDVEDNSNFEIVDDNLYDKLIDLVIYKDTLFHNGNGNGNENGNGNNNKNKNKNKNKKTKNNKKNNKNKNKNKNENENANENENENKNKKKQKYKLTRKNNEK